MRATLLEDELPSPAEILHGKDHLRTILIQKQAKYTLSHQKNHQAKHQRDLVVGEECLFLFTNDIGKHCIVTGICDSDRSYAIHTGWAILRMNRSYLKPNSFDIPLTASLYLQNEENFVLSAAPKQDEITVLLEATAIHNHTQNCNLVFSGP